MSLIGAAAIGAGASLLGGAASAKASASQAKKQMAFQEEMSNTAYQRAATDLEAAGLNRILALGSPATTPGGAMGQVPDFGSAMAQGANAGIGLASAASSIAKQKQETNKIIQETKNLSEKEKQEIEKSKLWQILGPIAQKAGNDFTKLTAMLNDIAPKLIEAGINSSKEAINAVSKLISEKYETSVNTFSDWMTAAQQQWIKIQKHNPRNAQ